MKDEELWERFKAWAVVGLVEMWTGGEEWKKWRRRVLKEFKWSIQRVKREGKKQRAEERDSVWIGIRREWERKRRMKKNQ